MDDFCESILKEELLNFNHLDIHDFSSNPNLVDTNNRREEQRQTAPTDRSVQAASGQSDRPVTPTGTNAPAVLGDGEGIAAPTEKQRLREQRRRAAAREQRRRAALEKQQSRAALEERQRRVILRERSRYDTPRERQGDLNNSRMHASRYSSNDVAMFPFKDQNVNFMTTEDTNVSKKSFHFLI